MADVQAKPRKPRKAKSSKTKDEEALLDAPASSAKMRVDEMLQQVVQQAKSDAVEAKKKKKKKKPAGDDVLESLRKGEGIEGLQKDQDNSMVANTYDPDNSPKNEKSNKRKQKMREAGKENKGYEDDEKPTIEEAPKKPVKKKRTKKPKADGDEEETSTKEALIKEEAPPVQEETTEPKESAPAAPEEKKKKKKKKKKEEKPEEEEQAAPEPEETQKEEEEVPAEEEEQKPETTKKKKKKKKAKEEEITQAEEEEEPPPVDDEGRVLAVLVHRTDQLKNDVRVLHPLVRVHVVDEATGHYLEKQHKDRAVTSFYEVKNEAVHGVLPILTQPFDFKERKSTLPVWEELLLFNENFNYFLQDKPKVILFFEVLDFVTMNTASNNYSQSKQEGGWYRIAWAFLKLRGANGKLNVGEKVRLQLFEPPSRFSRRGDQVEVYQWWSQGARSRVAYPSTLYVTLKGIIPPEEVEPAQRSMFATQEERGRMTYEDLKKSMNWDTKTRGEHRRPMTSWTRLLGQTCRIPNNRFLTLPASSKGCFFLKFSNDGRSLACACRGKEGYPIIVYEIPSGKLRGEFTGHFGIVYDLSWSKKDTLLLSASADGTARVWDLQNFGENCEKLLPHPSYVYAAQFHPRVDSIIATGGFDQVIRLWDIHGEESHGQLMQELENHHGHINTLCFNPEGNRMYSGDSTGVLIIWNCYVTEEVSRRAFIRDWTLYQEIKDIDVKCASISFIKLHPSSRRLLIQNRDNLIRMMDLRVQRVMQRYVGAMNFREKISSTITPCGTFVISGSEDGYAYVWNTDTGDQVARYNDLNYKQPVTCTDYHPRDHMVAFCSLGDNQPVQIYNYDPNIAQFEAGLSPRFRDPDSTTDVEDLTPRATARSLAAEKEREKELQSARSMVLSKDEFQAHETLRFQKVVKKLDTATMQMIQIPLPGELSMTHMSASRMLGDSALIPTTPRVMGTAPSTFSPHAPQTLSSIMSMQQFNSQNLYMKMADSDWRPGFSDVGRPRSSSPTFYGRPPHLTLRTSMGKAQFSFQQPPGKPLNQFKVVVMYDYKAQRSDELTLLRGDVVTVLHKDSESWWMGELPSGQQGFFPASYVVMEENVADLNQLAVQDDSDAETSKRKVTAIRTKSGNLTFVSGTEDSDTESDVARRRHKKGTRRASQGGSGSDAPLPTTKKAAKAAKTRFNVDDSSA